jgi:hypothetical protein
MDFSIQKATLEPENINGQQVWPLKVTVTLTGEAVMPSAKVFVFHARMDDDPYQGDVFECVSSLTQYYEIPPDAPTYEDSNYVVPYYRKESVQINCLTAEEAVDCWEIILDDLNDLVNNFYAARTLNNIATVEI